MEQISRVQGLKLMRPALGATKLPGAVGARTSTVRPITALSAMRLEADDFAKLRSRIAWVHNDASWPELMALLPPALAQKLQQSRSDALHKMLLAWGKSLRQEAKREQKARVQRDVKVQLAKVYAQAQAERANNQKKQLLASRLAAAEAKNVAYAAEFINGPPAEPIWGRGLTLTGFNAPLMEAFTLPMASGISLRSATLRLTR